MVIPGIVKQQQRPIHTHHHDDQLEPPDRLAPYLHSIPCDVTNTETLN